jgi:hypothetical protein
VRETSSSFRRGGALLLLLTAAAASAAPDAPTAAPAGGATSRLVVDHEDRLGSWFVLREAQLVLDGRPLRLAPIPTDGSVRGTTLPLHTGPLTAGRHVLEFSLVYGGAPGLLFSYVSGYQFHLRGRLVMEVPAGEEVELHTRAFERTGWDVSWQERPELAARAVPGDVVVEFTVEPVQVLEPTELMDCELVAARIPETGLPPAEAPRAPSAAAAPPSQEASAPGAGSKAF